MTARYQLTPKARDGLLRIAEDVAHGFGIVVAERVVTALERAFEQLATHPDIGHLREDLTNDREVRFWSVGPTLIAYRGSSSAIEIIAVERGELDWQQLLAEELG